MDANLVQVAAKNHGVDAQTPLGTDPTCPKKLSTRLLCARKPRFARVSAFTARPDAARIGFE
jgi:hypothetical protein